MENKVGSRPSENHQASNPMDKNTPEKDSSKQPDSGPERKESDVAALDGSQTSRPANFY